MIRIYLDWNVMAQMKNEQHAELQRILSDQEKFHVIYSTAHIGDIFAGFKDDAAHKKLMNEDLEFITQLTDNWCASTDTDKVVIDHRDPKYLLQERIETAVPLKQLGFGVGINNTEILAQLAKGKELLMNMPIHDLLKGAYQGVEGGKFMDKRYPGLRENQTMGGMIEATMAQFKRMNEATEYKEMREMVQHSLGINRDRLFDSEDPIAEIEKTYEKLGRPPYLEDFSHVPKWYGDILNWYILLDMHGYQEDRVRVDKGRKETFRNTTNDAFHTAFASTCDFYIINDKKALKKSQAVYRKLELNTQVMKPEEFVHHYNEYMFFQNVNDHFYTMINVFKSEPYEVLEDEHSILKSWYFPFFLFDMFTRAHINYDKETRKSLYFLSKHKPTNGKWTFRMEIEKLVKMLNSIFGEDIEKLGEYDPEKEDFTNEWQGRSWNFETVVFRLAFPNGWIQLYMDFKEDWPDEE